MAPDKNSLKPPRRLAHRLAIGVLLLPVYFYRYLISPLLGVNCRFSPSCSDFAKEAIIKHGALRGGLLTVKRILKCHPWGGSGYDPVP